MSVADHINRGSRRVPIWSVYLLGLLPPVWFLYLGLTGGLGVEPINALERELGKLGLQALILGFSITPLRRFLGVNLIRFRRSIGVLTFYYIACHLLVWLVLDVQILSQIWADILKRPYITIGMVGFLLMLPLAVTSNNWSVRKLGADWRKLHRLVYPAVVLGGLHYVMLAKTWQTEPLVYFAVILTLLATRIPVKLLTMAKRGQGAV
ncbi:protein-methionine-sulfoxide reductase heme-binding subunit MsrQ [Aliiroseovarius sp. KMU-50]|uniref:Protein-methionine-sulfoxide reductase heme-binding subunit MsrQ n=1 Tax=Aliiroseovarius salicola TaxID=3009082 RepID=A0ABT4VWR3_9RHOB|nr:protein-methionine-sulfoxide reductase heme-binding subunit MsrQ [Aliiroseovarius sp. KMU-50]MDA5092684.1 protein-methionine-sulfoxide reductase heme-binding subunit MsrQ [Aliiroseovarius sp. KMU-50]